MLVFYYVFVVLGVDLVYFFFNYINNKSRMIIFVKVKLGLMTSFLKKKTTQTPQLESNKNVGLFSSWDTHSKHKPRLVFDGGSAQLFDH